MSGSRHDFEAWARAFNTRKHSHESRDQCPEPEQLFEAASGTLEREQRLRIVDHVSQCGECTQAWRLAMEIGARPDNNVEQSSRLSRWQATGPARARSGILRQLALAAGVVCVVGFAAYLVVPLHEQPQYRDVLHKDAPVSRVTGSLTRDRFLLRWSAGPRESTYVLRLTTADLVPLLVEQDLTKPEFMVPAAALKDVASGAQLLWQVEVQLPNGERIASETFVVTLN